jgi:hypothetical protein
MLAFLISTAHAATPNCTVGVFVDQPSVPDSWRSAFPTALEGAIAAWNGVSPKVHLERRPGSLHEDTQGAVHVKWGTVTQDVPGGRKVATSFVSTGLEDRVSRARIIVDKDAPWCPAAADCFALKDVLLHELGHALGIPHVAEPGAVMFFNVLKEVRKPQLTPWDAEALRRVIPEHDPGCDTRSGSLTWSRFEK